MWRTAAIPLRRTLLLPLLYLAVFVSTQQATTLNGGDDTGSSGSSPPAPALTNDFEDCFGFNGQQAGNTRYGSRHSNEDELLDPAVFSPDMKLHSVEICENRRSGEIKSITFMLRTLASKLVTKQKLSTFGKFQSTFTSCSSMAILDAELIDYIEVTFGPTITSFVIMTNFNSFKQWGSAGPLDNINRWKFDLERQPIGVEGFAADYAGLNSVGIIYFSQPCIEEVIGYKIVPLGQAYNDDTLNQRDFKEEDPLAELSAWEKFVNSEYFVLFVLGVITFAVLAITGTFVAICRCCFLRKVRVDSMGLSSQDHKNPVGSILLTKELQEKMKERKLRKQQKARQLANQTRSGTVSVEDYEEGDYGDEEVNDEEDFAMEQAYLASQQQLNGGNSNNKALYARDSNGTTPTLTSRNLLGKSVYGGGDSKYKDSKYVTPSPLNKNFNSSVVTPQQIQSAKFEMANYNYDSDLSLRERRKDNSFGSSFAQPTSTKMILMGSADVSSAKQSQRTPNARLPLHHSHDNEYGVASSAGGGGFEQRRRLEHGRRSNSQDFNMASSAAANNMRYHEGGTTANSKEHQQSEYVGRSGWGNLQQRVQRSRSNDPPR